MDVSEPDVESAFGEKLRRFRQIHLEKLQKVKAEAEWKQAVGIMDSHTPGNLRLRRLRAEAEALLGDVAKPAADAQ